MRVGITRGNAVLDFDCGSGNYVIPAAHLVEGGTVYALDSDPETLEKVKARCSEAGLHNVEIIQSDDLDTRLPSAWVDAVLLFDVIHAVDEPRRLLEEMDRVLKPRGTVAVYPMHMDNTEVIRMMRELDFELAAEHYGGHILCLQRTQEMPDPVDDEPVTGGSRR